MTISAPFSRALEIAMVMPRSLKEPVGFKPSYFKKDYYPINTNSFCSLFNCFTFLCVLYATMQAFLSPLKKEDTTIRRYIYTKPTNQYQLFINAVVYKFILKDGTITHAKKEYVENALEEWKEIIKKKLSSSQINKIIYLYNEYTLITKLIATTKATVFVPQAIPANSPLETIINPLCSSPPKCKYKVVPEDQSQILFCYSEIHYYTTKVRNSK